MGKRRNSSALFVGGYGVHVHQKSEKISIAGVKLPPVFAI